MRCDNTCFNGMNFEKCYGEFTLVCILEASVAAFYAVSLGFLLWYMSLQGELHSANGLFHKHIVNWQLLTRRYMLASDAFLTMVDWLRSTAPCEKSPILPVSWGMRVVPLPSMESTCIGQRSLSRRGTTSILWTSMSQGRG